MSRPGTVGSLRTIPQVAGSEGWLLLAIVIVELKLAYSLPIDILSANPILESLVSSLERVITVLRYVTDETAQRPEVVRFYIFLTISLLPIKVGLFYRLLNSNRITVYRFLVVTPLTDERPGPDDYFINEPLREERGRKPQNRPRSLFSRMFWSTLILGFTGGMLWVLTAVQPSSRTSGINRKNLFESLVSEGFEMWWRWDLVAVSLTSFLLAVSICIFRDYCIILSKAVRR